MTRPFAAEGASTSDDAMAASAFAADLAAVSRFYRLSLLSAALKHAQGAALFAAFLSAAADEAGRLANEYAEIALFHWSVGRV